ncbi:MAG: hypothetical protein A2X80_11200 [Geobacteraceae bacterium GWB2_52_12]|nr:MAG: hypothetical protein A2X80_11200 [Geobacteraceae bacterium GWB2_52_12]
MKDFDAADDEYRTAVTLKPNHAKALYGLGKIALIKGDKAAATEFLLASQKADPTLLEAKQILNGLDEKDPFQPEPQKIKSYAKKKQKKSVKKTVSKKKKSVKKPVSKKKSATSIKKSASKKKKSAPSKTIVKKKTGTGAK